MPDSVSTAKLVIPPEIAEMLGPPPALLPQEVQLHERLLQAFAQEVQPHGVLDWLHVRHLADAELARQRYSRLTAKLIARPRQYQYDLAVDTLENELAQRVEEAKQAAEQHLRKSKLEVKGSVEDVNRQFEGLESESRQSLDAELEAIHGEYQNQRKDLEEHFAQTSDVGFLEDFIGQIERTERLAAAAKRDFGLTERAIERSAQWMAQAPHQPADLIEGQVVRTARELPGDESVGKIAQPAEAARAVGGDPDCDDQTEQQSLPGDQFEQVAAPRLIPQAGGEPVIKSDGVARLFPKLATLPEKAKALLEMKPHFAEIQRIAHEAGWGSKDVPDQTVVGEDEGK